MKSEIFLVVISWMNSCLGWMNRLHSNSKSSNLCIHPFSCLEKKWECANSSQHWGSTKGLFWAALAFWNTCLWTVNSCNERFINALALHLSVSGITLFISADSLLLGCINGHHVLVRELWLSSLYVCCFLSHFSVVTFTGCFDKSFCLKGKKKQDRSAYSVGPNLRRH